MFELLLNYYSVTALISFSMTTVLAIFLLRLPHKSRATVILGLIFLNFSLWNFAYFLAGIVYHPLMAYHLVWAVFGGLMVAPLFVQFFLAYPGDSFASFRRKFGVVHFALALVALGFFALGALQSDTNLRYNFEGHFWEIDRPDLLSYIGLIIGLSNLTFLVGIWRALKLRGRDRRALIGISVTVVLIGVTTSITNFLSRSGVLERSYHMTVFGLSLGIGFFFLALIYINVTRDRTSFMTKIVGISLTVLLTALQAVAYFTLGDAERAYDESRRNRLEIFLLGRRDVVPDDLLYVREIPADGRAAKVLFSRGPSAKIFEGARGRAESWGRLYLEGAPRASGVGTHAVAFRMSFEGSEYEAAYDYLAYRRAMSVPATRLALIVIALFLVVTIGFQFFLRGALLLPLRSLLRGVREVDKGDLTVRLPIGVQDEIGELTRYFNRMVTSIRDTRQELREYAGGLEEKVRQRTAELTSTLEEMQELKQQQDGDYYLTSLLLRPLGANRARSDTVKVETLVKQKKKFTFRKWHEEIGGDCCATYNIILNRRRYTAILNADAMGKSMQGAGGNLVLGAVFDAIIERTLLSSAARGVSPETWVKHTFIELHKVFEGFEGSMLVSLVLGLVDEECGLFYYINAEHPGTVLYRGGRAEFLEDPTEFLKLGTPGLSGGQLSIQLFQMRPDDVLIAGSDGRDDIVVSGENVEGVRVINDDENLFLRSVEAGGGELGDIHDALTKSGELTDDLSLLRISYLEDAALRDTGKEDEGMALVGRAEAAWQGGDAARALNFLREVRELGVARGPALRLEATIHMQRHEYERAGLLARQYVDVAPGDTEFLYLASYCLQKAERFEEAGECGERVRLRDPGHIDNLMNLVEIYTQLKNFARAERFAGDVLRLDPDNQSVHAARAKLRGAAR